MNQQISKMAIALSFNFGKRKKKFKNYKIVKQTQYLPDDELKSFRNERLRNLLAEANANIPYYKKLFSDHKIKADEINLDSINKIPFLTKDIIRENQSLLQNQVLPKSRFKENSTSGSSGRKTIFYSDLNAELFKAPLNWRSLNWVDIRFGDKELRIWGAMHDINKARSLVNRTKNYLTNKVILSSYKLNDKIIREYIEFTNSYKPDQIHAYPSSLYEIAKHIVDNKLNIFKPKAIFTSGEQLYDWQREKIKEAFSADVFSFYGCREVNIIAQECKKHEGMHIMAENILLEVVNDKGENIYDEEGEIVVTDLSNFVFPFVRYKIMDRGILTKKKCSCGINLPLLKSIHGRTFDLIKLVNGGSVGATFFTHLFREKPGIDDFRVYQNNIKKILVEYISGNKDLDITYFINQIKKQSDNCLEVEFNRVDNFNIPDSGKKQFIISNI